MIITTTNLQNSFGKYLQLCQNEEVIITKNGRKVAQLLPYTEDGILGRWLISEGSPRYSSKGIRVSYEEYLKITEESENRYEYIDGEIILLASPLYPHQKAIREILVSFSLWFKDKDCEPLDAPFDVVLHRLGDAKKINSVQPDIIVICDQDKIDEKGKYKGTPALVVEVLSDSTRSRDLVQKLDLYMESGIHEYWIVNTQSQEIYIYTFTDNKLANILTFKGEEHAQSVLFPGLEVSLKQTFA
ncbi:MAG: Uma2 family endonuclease [Eubacteriales bacterium]|nr:Uma2 family endonuclease [Eubacteriales bacterium]MDD4768917.1 Uma2 family endonuclease [Eubacteriales bacterium]